MEKPAELLLRTGESFFGYACCASIVAAGLLLPAALRARGRRHLGAIGVASTSFVVTTLTMAALCYVAVLVVQAQIE
jgi:hypothetical protein